MKEETSKKVTVEEEKSKVTNDSNKNKSPTRSMSLWKSVISTFLSRKLFALVVSFGLIWWVHEVTISHLYTLNTEHQTTAITTIYVATLSVLGVLVAAFMGTNAIQSKFGISGVAQLVSQSLSEKIQEDRTEKIDETYTEHIIIDEKVPNKNLREFQE